MTQTFVAEYSFERPKAAPYKEKKTRYFLPPAEDGENRHPVYGEETIKRMLKLGVPLIEEEDEVEMREDSKEFTKAIANFSSQMREDIGYFAEGRDMVGCMESTWEGYRIETPTHLKASEHLRRREALESFLLKHGIGPSPDGYRSSGWLLNCTTKHSDGACKPIVSAEAEALAQVTRGPAP